MADITVSLTRSMTTDVQINNGAFENALVAHKESLWMYDISLPSAFIKALNSQIDPDHLIGIAPGEPAKSWDGLQTIMTRLDALDITPDTPVVGLGGGALCDVVSFAASVYLRGLPLVLIPTTLLAMVDASVGGKTAINTTAKNRVGSFYPAQTVIIDSHFLTTLSPERMAEGFSEIIKMAVTMDATLTEALETNALDIDAIIGQAIQLKAAIVEKDLTDQGIRRLLNFGHTTGHALETLHDYAFSHGRCVASGMLMEVADPPLKKRLKSLLDMYECYAPIPYEKAALLEQIKTDKKRSKQTLTWIHLRRIGHAELEEIVLTDLAQYIPRYEEL